MVEYERLFREYMDATIKHFKEKGGNEGLALAKEATGKVLDALSEENKRLRKELAYASNRAMNMAFIGRSRGV